MSSVKLNKTIRDGVVGELTRHLRSQVEMVELEGSKLAKELYDSLYSKRERELIDSLPEGWFNTFDEFQIRDDNWCYTKLKLTFRERRPANLDPRNIREGKDILPGIDSGMWWASYLAWKQRLDEAQENLEAGRRQAHTVVNSVHTVGRLIEVWPEAEPALRRIELSPQRLLPAINFTELNKMLGLPEVVTA